MTLSEVLRVRDGGLFVENFLPHCNWFYCHCYVDLHASGSINYSRWKYSELDEDLLRKRLEQFRCQFEYTTVDEAATVMRLQVPEVRLLHSRNYKPWVDFWNSKPEVKNPRWRPPNKKTQILACSHDQWNSEGYTDVLSLAIHETCGITAGL